MTDHQKQLKNLKALCEQAEQLRKVAEKLCRDLEAQIAASKALHPPEQPEPRKRSRKGR